MIEKCTGTVNTVSIGATAAEGGTRGAAVKVGGETGLPFLADEGRMPNRPVIAMDVLDMRPSDWPEALASAYSGALDDPSAWARKCELEFGADVICLRFLGAHPENRNSSPQDVVKTVMSVRNATKLPMIIWGCGNKEKDNQIFPAVSQALKGDRVLLGTAVQDNYKTLAATVIADGHGIIAESPLDVNICKQVNILLMDMDVPADRIVIFPSTGALGYGFEYAYSIMERTRLAALGGDRAMAMPMLAVVGPEAWNAKEAKARQEDAPQWGAQAERGISWEAATAVGFLLAGSDILVMSHPKAVALTRKYVQAMVG
jgi:acetyl-CoA decarbonylase/synthase complex subunit delta